MKNNSAIVTEMFVSYTKLFKRVVNLGASKIMNPKYHDWASVQWSALLVCKGEMFVNILKNRH